MKKTIYSVALSGLLLMTACDDQLEIVPKGQTTLDNVTDIEMLLNQVYDMSTPPAEDMCMICNECFPMFTSVPGMFSSKNTLEYAYAAYDETVDRVSLSVSDRRYKTFYQMINYMNVVISKAPEAKGDKNLGRQIVAEAKLMRAYFHFLAVGMYARQYDEATAADLGGIPYVTTTDVAVQKTKLSLKETYEKILDDCTDEIIKSVPVVNNDVSRADQGFGNAVRAKVLIQMKRYDEALPYALAALKAKSVIDDRSVIKETSSWSLPQTSETNYVYMSAGLPSFPAYLTTSPEVSLLFEPGDYVKTYDSQGWSAMNASMYSSLDNALAYGGFSARGNVYGIRTEHMYYAAAECLIRTGKIREGLSYIDRVREKRVENYKPFVEVFDEQNLNESGAMELLRNAKVIEFIGTYDTFFDWKRWNTEEKYRRTITRDLGTLGKYSISPDSPLWVIPFPSEATRYNSSLTQNF